MSNGGEVGDMDNATQADLEMVIGSLREMIKPAIDDPGRRVSVDLEGTAGSVRVPAGRFVRSIPNGQEEYILRVRVGNAPRPVPWAEVADV